MQILLASAKTMRERCPDMGIRLTVPRFQTQAESMARDLSRKTGEELSELFGCSPQIGEQNRQRFAVFGTDEAELMPAILAYNGQAYKHLKAETLSLEDLGWMNAHLLISSCLYGLLRPFDGINPYRMEGGFALPSTSAAACCPDAATCCPDVATCCPDAATCCPDVAAVSLSTAGSSDTTATPLKVTDFWRPLLTETLIEAVKADDGVLLYLDTEEFRRLFDWKRVESQLRVVEPRFHVLKNGRMTTPSVWAKTCRGAMARFVVENRISDVSQLQAFSYEGFEWCEDCRCYIREG